MTSFFFYKNLINNENINKISYNTTIKDGYINVEYYNSENNILQINPNNNLNNFLLKGKIVTFNDLSFSQIINKINNLDNIKLDNILKYNVELIWANKLNGGTVKTYIIY